MKITKRITGNYVELTIDTINEYIWAGQKAENLIYNLIDIIEDLAYLNEMEFQYELKSKSEVQNEKQD